MDVRNAAADRFKLLPGPVAHPGKCACCGAVDRPVLDFDAELEWYGAIYLCSDCVAEAASKIDYVPKREVNMRALVSYLEQSDQWLVTSEFLSKLQRSYDEFDSAISTVFSSVLRSSTSAITALDINTVESPESDSERNSGESKSGESESATASGQIDDVIVDEGSVSISSRPRNVLGVDSPFGND